MADDRSREHEDLADAHALAFALRYSEGKRLHYSAEITAAIDAKRIMEHLTDAARPREKVARNGRRTSSRGHDRGLLKGRLAF
jgi:hypothetical protein